MEILANYSVLPVGYNLSQITIPDDVPIETVADVQLPPDWDSLTPGTETQRFGDRWVKEERSAVLSVPSSVVTSERNFIINPVHADFRKLHFSAPQRFVFDPRLR